MYNTNIIKHLRIPVLLIVVTAVLAACGGPSTESTDAGGVEPALAPDENVNEATVIVKDNIFVEKTITVKAGTTVTWIQEGVRRHTVTADDGLFDSGMMETGDTFSYTFTEPGTYPYYCVLHGAPGGVGHAGTVIVEP